MAATPSSTTAGPAQSLTAPSSTASASTDRRWKVLVVLCIAVFAINVDTTLVNVTLPTLVGQLNASTSQLQWVVDAYNLAFAALVLAAGSMSDRFGRKGALILGLAIFGTATAAGSLATTTGELITARAVMGIGAAIVFPNTLSILSNVFTDRTERAKAIGIWGATTGMGATRRHHGWTGPAWPCPPSPSACSSTRSSRPRPAAGPSRPRSPGWPRPRSSSSRSWRGSDVSRHQCSTSASSRTCGSRPPAPR